MLITIEAGTPPVKQSEAKNVDFKVEHTGKAYLHWSLSTTSKGPMPLVGDEVKASSGERAIFEGKVMSIKTSSGYVRISAAGTQP